MPLIPRLQLVFLCTMLLLVDASFGQQNQASDPLIVADDNRTPTWGETLAVFEELASGCEEACLIEIGTSDIGRPIHAFIMARAGMTSEDLAEVRTIRQGDKLGLLINNAIHP